MNAGDVASGRNDTAFAAANDHRLVGKLRIVTLLDRRVEGIAVDMCERQLAEFRVAKKPRAAAGQTPSRFGGLLPEAVSAEARNRCSAVGHIRNKC